MCDLFEADVISTCDVRTSNLGRLTLAGAKVSTDHQNDCPGLKQMVVNIRLNIIQKLQVPTLTSGNPVL